MKKSPLKIYSHDKRGTFPYYISLIEIGLLWAKIVYLKSHSMALAFALQTDIQIDLSYEVLNIDFDQGGAKISEVKVGDR